MSAYNTRNGLEASQLTAGAENTITSKFSHERAKRKKKTQKDSVA